MSRKLPKETWERIREQNRAARLEKYRLVDEPVETPVVRDIIPVVNPRFRVLRADAPEYVPITAQPVVPKITVLDVVVDAWNVYDPGPIKQEPGELDDYFEKRQRGESRIKLNGEYFNIFY